MTASDQEFTEKCEICIVGTGAAGGLLAYRLAMSGKQVVSIEQGGPIDDTYFTNDLTMESLPHFGMFPEIKWPTPPSEGYLHGNHRAYQLYAAPDLAATSPESDRRFVNRQIYRINGKLNTWKYL